MIRKFLLECIRKMMCMGVDKEYKINEHIQLRLEGGKTNIYLGNELFSQCKHL